MAHLPPLLEDLERREDKGCVLLARLMEVSPQCWRNWVNGTTVPTRRKAQHLAVLLETPGRSPAEIVRLINEDRDALAARRRAAPSQEPGTTATRRMPALPAAEVRP